MRQIDIRLRRRHGMPERLPTVNFGNSPPTRQYTVLGPWILAVAAFFVLIGFADVQEVQAFKKKAVDQLLETHKCVRCDLRGADLARKSLRNASLIGAYLIGANMEGADLRGANLGGAWVTKANLRRAKLEGAMLRGAHLIEVDLTGANLTRADLRSAKLARAVLVGANLHEAKLFGANLQGTRLNNVQGLGHKQLSSTCGDANTVLPTGLSIPFCDGSGQ